MIFPDVSLMNWLKRWSCLSVIEDQCDACGETLFTTIPFITKDYAGLTAPQCSCGKNKQTVSVTVTRTQKAIDDWYFFRD
ncbi:MAG: hypothetical protein F6K09_18890 [Merismopedia sp. SIO2A8]|nr:hypothetical protein [Symploca sp. SIO2B6]NET50712.1 hypothetical protein [Merismopedia sp. SIO2A8]